MTNTVLNTKISAVENKIHNNSKFFTTQNLISLQQKNLKEDYSKLI